ncbi:methylated-DNA--[protein]-cysteine S-methyltransferase [Caulobacter segnis]|uniref:methylated-DNA--[protein]-cysteine S-methyltransferase n=1 Tax=Caulobacter segnis TaxID=88688 RepID=UPI00240FCC60|nr:methylated-DNA--[protein]-cysteine S-methyltransferase [Caulobacter segnis]MDG2523661.1 methylated-DNA--[protein]-cysteine S-methyltransferase [Caulobacter segnis]
MSTLIFLSETLETPVGTLILLTDGQDRLRALDWVDYEERMLRLLRSQYRQPAAIKPRAGAPSAASHAMRAYFAGDLSAIDGLVTETGGTDFQRAVWKALRDIPAGQTVSYGALAAAIGKPKAVRAVGAANGANPVGVVVPCHRVIGSNASLTGYGGGLERKRWLLAHESAPHR